MADSFLSLPGSSGIISAGASVLGNLFNWFQTDSARAYEREMQNRQWQLAREQWERENAYNMPSAQMARLRAAGINPHLAFANGDVMNQAASSPTVPDAHQVQPYTVNPLEASSISLNLAQAEALKAQAKKTNAETPGIEARSYVEKFNARLIEMNEKQYESLALSAVESGLAENTATFYQACFASLEIAALLGDTAPLTDAKGKYTGYHTIAVPGAAHSPIFQVPGVLLQKVKEVTRGRYDQEALEQQLYDTFVEAQKKVNAAAGEEAELDKVLPEMINGAPDWLKPILVLLKAWLVDGKMPNMAFRTVRHDHQEFHTHQDNSTRRTIINKAN